MKAARRRGALSGQAVEEVAERWWKAREGREGMRRLVVGVSGGADSVALLHILHRRAPHWGVDLSVAHLDHGLRGTQGAEDRRFVTELARRLGLRYRTARAPAGACAAHAGLSMEMAARRARYAFFRRTLHAMNADAVALGHTRDDQAETLLLRLLRGTGPTGLGGMAPESRHSGVRVVRPLLEAGRDEVRTYLREHGLSWREDPSNRCRKPLRNRVRLEVMPRLLRIEPAAVEAMARASRWLREEDRYLEALASAALAECAAGAPLVLSADRLRALDPALRRRAWRRWLLDGDVPGDRLDAALFAELDRMLSAGERGSAWRPVAQGLRVERTYGSFRIVRAPGRSAMQAGMPVQVPGVTEARTAGWRLTARWAKGFARAREPGLPPVRTGCSLSRARAEGAKLRLRTWRAGDRISPLGMTGTRKIQDILGEARVPRSGRDRIPVVACENEVVWLPGYRIARGWEVPTPDAPALRLTLAPL